MVVGGTTNNQVIHQFGDDVLRGARSGPAQDASAVWFIDNLPENGCDFDSWRGALNWLEDVRLTLLRGGWESSP